MNFQQAEFEASAYTTEQYLASSLPEAVISGRSNVGKSSMINKLINRKSLARVSSAPGKTASVNFYRCGDARIVDLPGYGFARVSREEKAHWSELVEGFFDGERKIAVVMQLLDMRHAPSEDDLQMLDYLKERGIPYLIVLTKSDKLNKTEYADRLKAFEEELDGLLQPSLGLFPFSASTGAGADELKKAILSIIGRYAG